MDVLAVVDEKAIALRCAKSLEFQISNHKVMKRTKKANWELGFAANDDVFNV